MTIVKNTVKIRILYVVLIN